MEWSKGPECGKRMWQSLAGLTKACFLCPPPKCFDALGQLHGVLKGFMHGRSVGKGQLILLAMKFAFGYFVGQFGLVLPSNWEVHKAVPRLWIFSQHLPGRNDRLIHFCKYFSSEPDCMEVSVSCISGDWINKCKSSYHMVAQNGEETDVFQFQYARLLKDYNLLNLASFAHFWGPALWKT